MSHTDEPPAQPQPQVSIASRTFLPRAHPQSSHRTGPPAAASAVSRGGYRVCAAELLHPQRRWQCLEHGMGEDQTTASRTAPQTELEPTWSRLQSWCLAPLRREESERGLNRLSSRNGVTLRSCCFGPAPSAISKLASLGTGFAPPPPHSPASVILFVNWNRVIYPTKLCGSKDVYKYNWQVGSWVPGPGIQPSMS